MQPIIVPTAQPRKTVQSLMYQKIMPAGVARQTTLPNQKQKLQQQCQEFKEQLVANGLDDAQILEASEIGGLQLLTQPPSIPFS